MLKAKLKFPGIGIDRIGIELSVLSSDSKNQDFKSFSKVIASYTRNLVQKLCSSPLFQPLRLLASIKNIEFVFIRLNEFYNKIARRFFQKHLVTVFIT